MFVRVEFRKRGTLDMVEVEFAQGMILPKASDRIVSPFNPERTWHAGGPLSYRFRVTLQ